MGISRPQIVASVTVRFSGGSSILLLSPQSLGSDFIKAKEIPRILERQALNGSAENPALYPILLIPCAGLRAYPWLRTPNMLPKHGKALSDFEMTAGKDERNRVMAEIANDVSLLITKVTTQPASIEARNSELATGSVELSKGSDEIDPSQKPHRRLVVFGAGGAILTVAAASARFWSNPESQAQEPDWVNNPNLATDDFVTAVASVETGGLVFGTLHGSVFVRYRHDDKESYQLQGDHSGRVISVVGNGRVILSSGEDGVVRRWDYTNREDLPPVPGSRFRTSGVAFSRDGKYIVTGGHDGTIRTWDIRTNMAGPVGPLEPFSSINCLIGERYNRSGIIVGDTDGRLRFWDIQKQAEYAEPVNAHSGEVTSVCVSETGAWFVTGGGDGTIRLWNNSDRSPFPAPLLGHIGGIASLSISGDDSQILSGGYDGSVRLWDVKKLEQVGKPIYQYPGPVVAGFLHGRTDQIVSGNSDGIKIWRLT